MRTPLRRSCNAVLLISDDCLNVVRCLIGPESLPVLLKGQGCNQNLRRHYPVVFLLRHSFHHRDQLCYGRLDVRRVCFTLQLSLQPFLVLIRHLTWVGYSLRVPQLLSEVRNCEVDCKSSLCTGSWLKWHVVKCFFKWCLPANDLSHISHLNPIEELWNLS